MTDENIITSTLADFDKFLSARGLRHTPERYVILRKVLTMNKHFIVERLHEAIESDGYPLSRATVYNTIQLLTEAGIVRRHQFGNAPAQYEKTLGASMSSHHHLICNRCGKVKEVKDPAMMKAIGETRYRSFTPDYFTLYVYGICSACQRQLRRKLDDSNQK